MTTTEEWRTIPGWEGLYEASSEGRIRSLDRTVIRSDGFPIRVKGQVLKPVTAKTGGYLTVAPSRNGQQRMVFVHLLVAAAFHGPRPDGCEVRHLNGNNLDNRAANLRWGTHAENVGDTIRHGNHYQLAKTHCPQRHPYNEANTYVWVNPKTGGKARMCRTCIAARKRAKTT